MKATLLIAALSIVGITRGEVNPNSPLDAAKQEEVLGDARSYVVGHEAKLPDFMCTQTIRRFENYDDQGWRPIDVIVEDLTYSNHREFYKVITRNGQPVNITHDQLRGLSSSGEFGSTMNALFLRQTAAIFTWHDWHTLRGRQMFVFSYQVPASRSAYHLKVPEQLLDLVAGYHGLVYIDGENHFVHRVTLYADDIPPAFPIQDVSLTLDYDYRRIGDADYLLPVHFELVSQQGHRFIKNEVDYDDYQKFNAVSIIVFGAPDGSKR
jgi:hypothetical protein